MWKSTVQDYYKELGLKFKLPKKGSEDYIKIREIYDKKEKPPKKAAAPKKPKATTAADAGVLSSTAKPRGRPRKNAIKTTTTPAVITAEAVGPTHIFTDASEKPQRQSKTKISKPRKSTALYKREENLRLIAETELNDDKTRKQKIEKLKKDILDAEEVTSFKEEVKTKKKKSKEAAEEAARALEEESKMVVEVDPTETYEREVATRREKLTKKAEEELDKFLIEEDIKEKKDQLRRERAAAKAPREPEPMVIDEVSGISDIIPTDDVKKEAFLEAANAGVHDEVGVTDDINMLEDLVNSKVRGRDIEPTLAKKKRKVGGGRNAATGGRNAAAQHTSIASNDSARPTRAGGAPAKPRRLFVKF